MDESRTHTFFPTHCLGNGAVGNRLWISTMHFHGWVSPCVMNTWCVKTHDELWRHACWNASDLLSNVHNARCARLWGSIWFLIYQLGIAWGTPGLEPLQGPMGVPRSQQPEFICHTVSAALAAFMTLCNDFSVFFSHPGCSRVQPGIWPGNQQPSL